MANISGHVYYDQTNVLAPGIGIANVPVALFDPKGLLGAIALTDNAGAFAFTNIPNGSFQVIEAWGATGGLPTPVNYATSAVATLVAPTKKEPPLSALSVVPPALADKLHARTPNLLNITVTGSDITNLVFFNAPVGDKGQVFLVGPNLIADADNGTFGSDPPETAGTMIPPVAPYPATTPIPNTAEAFAFALDPAASDGQPGSSSNTVNIQVNSAIVKTVKTADKAFANVGDTITYTITVTNSGNVVANNVVLTDALSAGTTFVAASLLGATGTLPTLTLNAPVPAGGSVAVSYQVLVGANVPNPNPVENRASAAFTYTVNSEKPNGASGVSYSNTVDIQVNSAKLLMQKSVDKFVAYLNDTITYQIALTNTSNAPANAVVITDPIPDGTALVPSSMTVSVPYTALPGGAIQLSNPVQPRETVTISFKVLVTAIPNQNPIVNMASAVFTYTVDPENPDGVSAAAQTNAVRTTLFRYNFGQQISDLIESVALEQAALAAIVNAEGAKIQRMAAMPGVTSQQLLCLNKSVSDMTDSIAMLEAALRLKLNIVKCQIDGTTC